jgi:hypothetical protein
MTCTTSHRTSPSLTMRSVPPQWCLVRCLIYITTARLLQRPQHDAGHRDYAWRRGIYQRDPLHDRPPHREGPVHVGAHPHYLAPDRARHALPGPSALVRPRRGRVDRRVRVCYGGVEALPCHPAGTAGGASAPCVCAQLRRTSYSATRRCTRRASHRRQARPPA